MNGGCTPSTCIPLTLVGLMLVAGCTGISGPGGTGATPGSGTATPTLDPSPTESPTTTAPAAEVTDYPEPPNETQRSVRAAIENGSVVRDSDAFDGLDPREKQYDRYDGTAYSLAWDTVHGRMEYAVNDVESVTASSPGSGAAVIAYLNLSATAKRLFDRAQIGSCPRMYGPEGFRRAYLEYG